MNGIAQNKKVAQSFIQIADAISRGEADWSQMRALIAGDFRLHTPGENAPVDFDTGFIKMSSAMMQGFPNFTHVIEFQIGEGDKVANCITWRGVHTGIFENIEPTNREVSMRIINIMRFEAGKIAEFWRLSDITGLLGQIKSPQNNG